jgi:zinc and cadmium transporter
MAHLVEYIAVILAVAAIGGVLPFVRRWRSEVLHLFIAFGAGVFLGAVFFHLLPDVRASRDAFVFVLAGFLLVLLFEQLTATHHDEDCGPDCPHRHDVVGAAAFVGLVIHSLTAGFALGVGMLADPELGFVMFFAIVAHKAVAAFSLATVLRLSTFSVRRSVCLLIAFALTTPVGAVVAYVLMSGLSPKAIQVPTALAAGTFLYVATMDLLPEAFHVRGRRRAAGLSMLVGLAAMLLISYVGP